MNATSHKAKQERHLDASGRAILSIFGLSNTPGIAPGPWRVHCAFDPKKSLPYPARHTPRVPSPADNTMQVAHNDVVVLAGHRGTWKVVAPVNGTKADIRRRATFDMRIVTTPVRNLTVVRRAGSPGCSY